MLTIKHRVYDRLKQLNDDSQQSLEEKSKQTIESKVSIKSKKNYELTETQLLEKINKINQENENIRRENLLFSRYLFRVNSSKIVETFDEYEYHDENDLIHQILEQTKSSDLTPRLAMKRISNNTKKGTSGWTKVSVNWGELMYTPYILRIEQERFAIAAYELEQTRLEWERMNAKATAVLYKLEVSYQSIESDKIAQETLNRELGRRVDRYRANIGEEEFNNPYMHVPGEFVVGRVNKRIQSRTSLIGLLRVSTTRIYIRINDINIKIRSLDDLNDKMEEVDIVTMRTRKINNSEIYTKVDRTYQMEKSSQYSLFRRLQEDRKNLTEQEISIKDIKKKCELLQNYYERTVIEINSIQQEYDFILKENNLLKHRITDISRVPTITDYAHIIEQTKVLQHEIDIWSKRVHIAETLSLQLKRQKKLPRRLPPLQSTTIDEHHTN